MLLLLTINYVQIVKKIVLVIVNNYNTSIGSGNQFLYHHITMITLVAKRRQEGMVIMLCVHVCVCLFTNVWENNEHWQLKWATGRPQIIQGTK